MWQMSLHSWNFRPHVCGVTAVALLLTEQWSICRDVSDWSVVRSITLLKVSTRREQSSFYALHPNWFIRRGNRFIVISYCTGRNKNSTNQLSSCTPLIKWSYFYSHNIISDQFLDNGENVFTLHWHKNSTFNSLLCLLKKKVRLIITWLQSNNVTYSIFNLIMC